MLWGIDNKLTRNISAKDPVTIVIVKGIGAGLFMVLLSVALKAEMPEPFSVASGLALGSFSCGISLILFILALREIGSARAGALFASAPFIGVVVSFVIFRNQPSLNYLVSFPLMLIGAVLLFKESHGHLH